MYSVPVLIPFAQTSSPLIGPSSLHHQAHITTRSVMEPSSPSHHLVPPRWRALLISLIA